MLWVLVVGCVVAAVFALDHLLLAAESRGWVYYRRMGVSRPQIGNALMTVQSVYEPEKAHTVDERRRYDAEEAEEDEP